MKKCTLIFGIILFAAGCDNRSTPVQSSYQSLHETKRVQLYEPGGKNPAAGATVKFFDIAADNDTPAAVFITDESGGYSVEELPAGDYHLWAEKNSLVLFQDSIRVTADSATLSKGTLRCAASLSGIVNLHPDHDPRTVTIRLAHSGKLAKVAEIGGGFTLRGLAEGTHLLRVESTLPDYTPFTEKVFVTACSNDTLDDTLRMVYGGIPIIAHAKLSLDTLAGTIRLFWDKVTSSSLQDYLIYKDECDDVRFSETVFAATKDTFFIDSSYAGRTANSLDTQQQCAAYRIAVRTATQEIGPQSRNATIPVVPKSFVNTYFSYRVRYAQPDCDSATIHDTVLLSVTARNRTRSLRSVQWYDNVAQRTVSILNADTTLHVTTISDTIAYAFDSARTNYMRVTVYDDAGTKWTTSLPVKIVRDMPIVSTGNDTGVLIGTAVHLRGSAQQQFGSIELWEWKIGSGSWNRTAAADTIITAPLTEQITACSLAVTDDDGYRVKNGMKIITSVAAQKVAACSSHSFILKTDKTLLAFGNGDFGQLGDGSSTTRHYPAAVMSEVQSMAAGRMHSLILKTDGSLWACGDNSYGQLGDGTNEKRNPPLPVMSGVKKVVAGNTHSLILKTDGSLWACGNNSCGQLGDSTKENRRTPVAVMSDVQSMAAGAFHSVILKTDGTVWTCGENGGGQLGTGTTEDSPIPVQVMSSVQSVAAGGWHSLFLTTTGVLWGCGNNGYGQLGDGTIERRLRPVEVMDGIDDMATSVYYTLILKIDGTLLVCGLNPAGQVPRENRYTPFPLMTQVQSMGAGWLHCLILKTDGTVWTCGKNSTGQLGDGTLEDRMAPVCIIPPQRTEN